MRYKIFSALLAPALCALALAPQPASAEAGKAALVIGNGAYQGGHVLAACEQSARDVGAWLQRQGFQVDQVLNGSSVAMRSAIGNFVTRVSGAPQKTAIIYVCTYAAVANQRLFMLPVDSDPGQLARLETQGVVLKALLNTLAGTNGVLFADLGMQPDKNAADAVDALQAGLPTGVHFAIVARNDNGIGTLGRGLPGLLSSSGQDWGRLSTAFQTEHSASQGDKLAVFAPLAGPMPPLVDAGAAAPAVAAAPPPSAAPAVVAAATPAPAAPSPAAPNPATAATVAAASAVAASSGAASSANSGEHPAEQVASAPSGTEASPQAAPAEAPKAAPLQLVPPRPPVVTPPATSGSTAPGAEPAKPAAPTVTTASLAPNPAPAAPAAQPATPKPDLRSSRIQAALARRGFYAGPASGRMDSHTKDAIRAFQTAIGDAPSGVLTQIQIAKLLNIGQ